MPAVAVQPVHQDAGGYGVAENVAATAAAVEAPSPDGEVATAGGGAETPIVIKPIVREADKVGRNDPCPCGSGKKYKKCCGA